MIADLLTRLEEEKDQWIYEAIDHFNEETVRDGGQKYEKGQVLIGVYRPTQVGITPENQIMQIRNIEYSISKQKNLDLERMRNEIKMIEESKDEDQRVYVSLESTVHYLQEELEFYEAEGRVLDEIQLEKYRCLLGEHFEFDKKDQVVFKERKISKLLQSFQMVEMAMFDFYQKQLSHTWLLLTRSMQNISSTARFDFNTDPTLVGLSLKHGRGIDQYLKPGNFEEDYRIVLDTLERNNDITYDYYVSQINQFKSNGKKDIMQLLTLKNEHKRLADENLLEEREKQQQKEVRRIELQDKLERAKREWEQDLLRPKLLDDILKAEFVKALSSWQEKLFADDASDVERWAYHQYCQIILKQAERIIGNDYF
ncbi:hypothetical protein [Bacillus sp. OK048]|uniref:hypothetical protein n=1 Tax=Bacillus sp. OK048 TaxID=1882761 RepID=UPI0008820E76|nr:hypothetical protein [Bacillus sp. OK048]SDM85480.1 hypothetical protein SAMN05443253_10660 [Bacillus sp. OK048]